MLSFPNLILIAFNLNIFYSIYLADAFSITVQNSAASIGREAWNTLITPNTSPFCEYDWIHTLEISECACANTGWQPVHLAVFDNNNILNLPMILTTEDKSFTQSNLQQQIISSDRKVLVAICLLYVKYHSMGEFIFDHSWADYAESVLGIQYYPKLLSAVPFTPATGERILYHPLISIEQKQEIADLIAKASISLTQQNRLSSSHVNFMRENETSAYLKNKYALRQTVQYRWQNINRLTNTKYASFTEYLDNFKSKKRIQIKRERDIVYNEEKITLEYIKGDMATPELYQTMYEIYTTTVEKKWGTQYLSSEFFQLLTKCPDTFKTNILFIVAKQNNIIVAGTINFIKNTHLYGRYWGSFQYVRNLHFEVCYYAAIEYCILHNLEFFEPGAGGGEFKYLRGFDPYLVSSVHYCANPQFKLAVDNFLELERNKNQELTNYLVENSYTNNANNAK